MNLDAAIEVSRPNQKDQSNWEIESFRIERAMLMQLSDVYTYLIEEGAINTPEEDRRAFVDLRNSLITNYESWQMLNSGRAGAAFCRLLGSEIMEDLPQIVQENEGVGNEDTVVVKRPIDNTDVGRIEMLIPFGAEKPPKKCNFVFQTSLEKIRERIGLVSEKINS